MVDGNNNTPAGYASSSYAAFNGSSGSSRHHLWLPIAVAEAIRIENAAAIEADSMDKPFSRKKPEVSAQNHVTTAKNFKDELKIRIGTEHDFADATALAERFLKKTNNSLDAVTAEFSKDLFIATAIYIATTEKVRTIKSMFHFLIDPAWDSERQVLECFISAREFFQQKETYFWFAKFSKKINQLSPARATYILRKCHSHWESAITGSAAKVKPRAGVQVFNQDATNKAMDAVSNIKDDRKAGGDHLLENARINAGFRIVPDAIKAGRNLEKAKKQFENLIEPIDRLQVDLTLAGAMAPEDFRITPILLLGDPGIGKTFLAMQLAEALGVGMEKISAGGAQGGFQLSGSHTSWTGSRPGSLFTLLAEGKHAAPVVVIDEVDKIRDAQYPILPVLLDLFEPNTAVRFKDEFFGMEFDASKIIFVLTANSLDGVPAPLLSRVEVFDVPRPAPAQRLRIIQNEAATLRAKTKRQIKLDKDSSEALANRQDIDLRKTTRLVKEAFTRAMRAGNNVASLVIPKMDGRRQIGFVC